MNNKYMRLLRPQQWIKNFFVFAPLIFSRHLVDSYYVVQAVESFAIFCLISSVVYIINDVFDREADKLHPIKKMRPIASGEISIVRALLISSGLLIIAVIAGLNLSIEFQCVAFGYLILQFFYSWKLKEIVLLDVFVIAGGFMLRVVAGAAAIGVEISTWIIICTLFLSLFLAAAKRRGELVLLRDVPEFGHRKVLAHYDIELLDQMITIAATGMAISYALYTVADRTISAFGTENLIFTTIFVLFGIFRYQFLVLRRNLGENPVTAILRDLPMLLNIILWFGTCVILIYF